MTPTEYRHPTRFGDGPAPGTPAGVWTRAAGAASVSPTASHHAGATPPPLGELRRVVPVAQTRAHGGTALTLLSFEAYDNGCLVHVRLVPSRAWAVEAGSFLRPELSPEAADDRGRGHAARPHGMTGDGHEWRVQFVLAPALDPAAREGRLTVPALRWQRLERGARPGPPTRPCPAPGPALST